MSACAFGDDKITFYYPAEMEAKSRKVVVQFDYYTPTVILSGAVFQA
ncbi:MAG: hypothetical protein WCC37_08460 [Candidatus Sulfotelmatobacter sp.]